MERAYRFARDEQGATAIEYGLIACVLALAIIAAFPLVRPGLTVAFETVSDRMDEISSELEE